MYLGGIVFVVETPAGPKRRNGMYDNGSNLAGNRVNCCHEISFSGNPDCASGRLPGGFYNRSGTTTFRASSCGWRVLSKSLYSGGNTAGFDPHYFYEALP